MNRKGFSLVEMLVALGLLAVLAFLVYGGIQSVREKSLQVGCVSNLRQVGSDVRLYLSENNGILPWLEQPYVTTRWWYRLYSAGQFAHFDDRLICPADTDPYTLSYKPMPGRTLKCSYRFNKQFGFSESTGEQKLGGTRRNFLVASNPSRLKMITDGPRAPAGGRAHGSSDSMGFGNANDIFGNERQAMHTQGTRTTILFLDGHAEIATRPDFELLDAVPRF